MPATITAAQLRRLASLREQGLFHDEPLYVKDRGYYVDVDGYGSVIVTPEGTDIETCPDCFAEVEYVDDCWRHKDPAIGCFLYRVREVDAPEPAPTATLREQTECPTCGSEDFGTCAATAEREDEADLSECDRCGTTWPVSEAGRLHLLAR